MPYCKPSNNQTGHLKKGKKKKQKGQKGEEKRKKGEKKKKGQKRKKRAKKEKKKDVIFWHLLVEFVDILYLSTHHLLREYLYRFTNMKDNKN